MDVENLYETDINLQFDNLDRFKSMINYDIDFQKVFTSLESIKKNVY